MPPTNPSAIVDAIVTDLEANAGLPAGQPESTRKYAEPVLAPSDKLPILAVWCEDTTFRIETTTTFMGGPTAAYERTHDVNIGWYVANPKGSELGGIGDPAIVQSLEATVELLIARIAVYSGGLPGGLGPMVYGTLLSRHLKPLQGNVWRGLVVIEVREDA
jgi:hypothetical protein